MKRMTDDIFRALIKCTEVLPETELSRRTGVGLWQIKRYLNQQTDMIRGETWDKIYPILKPYLSSPVEPENEMPPRIGKPARRHKDLVPLVSDQKIVLDLYNALNSDNRSAMVAEWRKMVSKSGAKRGKYELGSLTPAENELLELFDGLSPEERAMGLKKYCALATEQLKEEREALF